MKKQYRKYSDEIKEIIIRTGNPNAFPELNIPRSTALYWIRHSKKKVSIGDRRINSANKNEVEYLKNKLEKERAKVCFLKEVNTLLSDEVSIKKSKKICAVISKYSQYHSATILCHLAKIDHSKYMRYKFNTSTNRSLYLRRSKLSSKELRIIERLSKSKSLSHLPAKRLQLYAYRKGLLYCSYGTWRKYIKIFSERRNKKKYNKSKNRIGLRATRPNDIWHIDITEFKSKPHGKIYLQSVIDNYSRKIVSWRISHTKDKSVTLKTLKCVLKVETPKMIVFDGGKENTAIDVSNLLQMKNIKKFICKKDIRFSNSMVESFFNILKSNYVNKYRCYNFVELYKTIKEAIRKYHLAPIPCHHGANALEIYNRNINTLFLKEDLRYKIMTSSLDRYQK